MRRLVVVKFLPANPDPGTAYGWHDLRCAAELMRCYKARPRRWKHRDRGLGTNQRSIGPGCRICFGPGIVNSEWADSGKGGCGG
jgi:hypothetical protein